jgi:hypothetical protein
MRAHEPRRPAERLSSAWTDVAWPVLAGALTAVGLLALSRQYGLLDVALILVGLWLFFALMLYAVGQDSGVGPRRALRIGLAAAATAVALLGLADLFPRAGWLAALVLGISSPAVVDRLTARLRRVRRVPTRRTSYGEAREQARVDRAFEQIVAELGRDVS